MCLSRLKTYLLYLNLSCSSLAPLKKMEPQFYGAPIMYMFRTSSLPKECYTPPLPPQCEICGGRHRQHECSEWAPRKPPEEEGPRFLPAQWWPDPPQWSSSTGKACVVKVHRGKATFPPMASFKWRRLVHTMLWTYSNTESYAMADTFMHR